MKKYFFMAMAAAVMLLSACNDDDSSSSSWHYATEQERAIMKLAVSGSYNGIVRYAKDSYTKVDSVQAAWNANPSDSINGMTYYNFPFNILAHSLYRDNQKADSAIVASLAPATFRSSLFVPMQVFNAYYENGIYSYGSIPANRRVELTTSDDHNVTFVFANQMSFSDNYTSVQYSSTINVWSKERVYQQMLLVDSIYVDNNKWQVRFPLVLFSRR